VRVGDRIRVLTYADAFCERWERGTYRGYDEVWMHHFVLRDGQAHEERYDFGVDPLGLLEQLADVRQSPKGDFERRRFAHEIVAHRTLR